MVLPTRVMKPRDKAKVEVAVQIVERFVLAKLRNRRFFSLAELNAAIRDCVTAINAKVMKQARQEPHTSCWRRSIVRRSMRCRATPYRYAEWKRAAASRPTITSRSTDHYYSVPSRLIRETVEARITDATVEVFHKGQRVASHCVLSVRNRHTTITRAHAERASPLRRMDAGNA